MQSVHSFVEVIGWGILIGAATYCMMYCIDFFFDIRIHVTDFSYWKRDINSELKEAFNRIRSLEDKYDAKFQIKQPNKTKRMR